MDFALVLLVGLAVWRLTYMLHKEAGPLDVFMRLRAFLANKQKRSGGLYDAFSCFLCLSVWVSALFALFLATGPLSWIMLTLALSTIAIIVQKVLSKL